MARAVVEVVGDIQAFAEEMRKLPGVTDKEAAKAAMKLQQRMESAQKAAAKAAERASAKAAEANSSVGRFASNAELFERMRAALGPLGDSLGDVTGGMDDLGTALGSFSVKQVAAATGILAVVAGVVQLTSSVADVIVNLEDYRDTIDDLQSKDMISNDQIAQLETASAAIDVISESWSGLTVVLASRVAPMVTNLVRGIVAASGFVTGGFQGMHQAAADFNAELRKTVEETRKLEDAGASDAAAKRSDADREAAAAAIKAAQDRAAAQQALSAMIETAMMREADGREKIALRFQAEIDKVYELMTLYPELQGQAESMLDLLQAQRAAEIELYDTKLVEQLDREKQDAHDREMKRRAEARKAAEQAAAAVEAEHRRIQGALMSSSQAVVSNISASLDSITQMLDTSTAEGRRAARSMAVTQRTLAIFQVGLNLMQAIAQSFGQAGPVAGAALAVAVTGAFAGILAAVSKPLPSFHTGRFGYNSGMVGDESTYGGVKTVSPEVVVPPDIVSRVGGADAVRGRLEDDRPMVLQAVLDFGDERILAPMVRMVSAGARASMGTPLGRAI